jgi:hypothetical protein
MRGSGLFIAKRDACLKTLKTTTGRALEESKSKEGAAMSRGIKKPCLKSRQMYKVAFRCPQIDAADFRYLHHTSSPFSP